MTVTGQQQQLPKITLDLEFINEIVGYLSKQPYNEVFKLIGNLHQEAQNQLGQQLPGGNDEKKDDE